MARSELASAEQIAILACFSVKSVSDSLLFICFACLCFSFFIFYLVCMSLAICCSPLRTPLACGSCHFKSTLPILICGSFYTQPPLLTSIAEALFDMMIPLRHRSWVLRCPSEPTFAHHDRHHRPSLNPSSLSFCHGTLTSYCMATASFATDISPLHTLKIIY